VKLSLLQKFAVAAALKEAGTMTRRCWESVNMYNSAFPPLRIAARKSRLKHIRGHARGVYSSRVAGVPLEEIACLLMKSHLPPSLHHKFGLALGRALR